MGITLFLGFFQILFYLLALFLSFQPLFEFFKYIFVGKSYGRYREGGYTGPGEFPLYNNKGQNGPKKALKWSFWAQKCSNCPKISHKHVF